MKFNFVLMMDYGDQELERKEIGEMTLGEIKEFATMIEENGETVEGLMYEQLKYCIEEKAFHLYLA